MLAAVITAQNEEINIQDCLKSLSWCDFLYVVDSGSTDRTVELATEAGAQVFINSPFPSFGKQRNWALENCGISCDWVLFLDADERATDAFRDEVLDLVSNPREGIVGYYCCWKLMLEGRWLKRCDRFPNWQMRLVNRHLVTFADGGHGQKPGKIKGELGYIKEPYIHYSFSKGWTEWWARHNRYASLEANFRFDAVINWKNLKSHDPIVRAKTRRALFSKMPFSCTLFFLYNYILRLGFIEGNPGFVFCVNRAYYEFMIKLKMREKRHGMKI